MSVTIIMRNSKQIVGLLALRVSTASCTAICVVSIEITHSHLEVREGFSKYFVPTAVM